MSTFFAPHASSEEESHSVLASVRKFLSSFGFATDAEPFERIRFKHDGRAYDLGVGEMHPDLREEVLIILKAVEEPLYYICTANRGVVRGEPYLVGERDGTVATPFTE